MSDSPSLSSAGKSAATKRHVYSQRIKLAFETLKNDVKRKRLTLTDVCLCAGVSADPIYKPHHLELRKWLEDEISEWYSSKSRRRGRVPENELEKEIIRLKEENISLEKRLKNTQQALIVVGQLLENCIGSTDTNNVISFPNRK